AGGAKLRPFPADMMTEAYKASNEIYAETSAKNANFKKVYDDMVKFRADENLWFRFTEMSFDRFMQAQKL
ncbi:MAG TPA: ABC transporter substrate-binding protein, partial [Ramlibacter sp.]